LTLPNGFPLLELEYHGVSGIGKKVWKIKPYPNWAPLKPLESFSKCITIQSEVIFRIQILETEIMAQKNVKKSNS
jgi:hypothetical protein